MSNTTLQELAEKKYPLSTSNNLKIATEVNREQLLRREGFLAGAKHSGLSVAIEALDKIWEITLDCHTQVEVAQIAEISRDVLDNIKKENYSPDLVKAATRLRDLHLSEMEGLLSGKPTREQWLEAVDRLSDALDKVKNNKQ